MCKLILRNLFSFYFLLYNASRQIYPNWSSTTLGHNMCREGETKKNVGESCSDGFHGQ